MNEDRTTQLYRVRMAARRRMVRRGTIYLAAIYGKVALIDRTTACRLYQEAALLFATLSQLEE